MHAQPMPLTPSPSEHCFVYEECTVPAGITLDEWRRAPRGLKRARRRGMHAWLGRLVR